MTPRTPFPLFSPVPPSYRRLTREECAAGPGPYACPSCGGGSFSRLDHLADHIRRAHAQLSTRERSLLMDRVRWPGKGA